MSSSFVHDFSSSAQVLLMQQTSSWFVKRLFVFPPSVFLAVFDDDPTVPTTTNLYIGCINPKVGTTFTSLIPE